MTENDWWKDFIGQLKIRANIALLILVDCALVAFAVFIFWATETYVIRKLMLSGTMEKWVVFTFRIFLAVSMLVIIGMYLYLDIGAMIEKLR